MIPPPKLYLTSVKDGEIDVALTPVKELLDKWRTEGTSV